MAKLRPLKFRLLELFSDDKAHWDNEIVIQLQKEYGMNSDFGRDSINFDIIELASGCLLEAVETKVDEDGIYKKGFLLHKYIITDFGKTRAADAGLK